MQDALTDEGWDVVGDVHGCASQLVELLTAMGYDDSDGGWRHPRRRVVFVGDLIDRGPENVVAVHIARSMVEAGAARIVAGNHEFNAIAYATRDPERQGRYLRDHVRKGPEHQVFLDQVAFDSASHRTMIDWFRTLPLWLDLDGLRVVHACWDDTSIDTIRRTLDPDDPMPTAFVERATRHGTDEWQAIEYLLKGPEVAVEPAYLDKGGTRRTNARFRWWDPEASTLRSGALIPANTTTPTGEDYPALPDTPIEPPVDPYRSEVPLIYGHYWESGTPSRSSAKTACVDYSAVKGGELVAYRWSGESDLRDENYLAVPGHRV